MNIVWLLVFWAMQVFITLAFKWGSTSKKRWLPGFIVGNVVGISSTWILMLLFERMNANIGYGLGFGGAFLLAQLAIAFVFRSRLSATQYAGLIAITVGMYFLATGGAA